MEESFVDYPKSGILFISFQNDIRIFEEMKKSMAQELKKPPSPKQLADLVNHSNENVVVKKTFDTLTLGGGYYFYSSHSKQKNL